MAKKPASGAGWYVLSRLDHDNVLYEPGDGVDLPDAAAEVLAPLGVISRVAPQPDPQEPAPQP